jgi:hypothetical protein
LEVAPGTNSAPGRERKAHHLPGTLDRSCRSRQEVAQEVPSALEWPQVRAMAADGHVAARDVQAPGHQATHGQADARLKRATSLPACAPGHEGRPIRAGHPADARRVAADQGAAHDAAPARAGLPTLAAGALSGLEVVLDSDNLAPATASAGRHSVGPKPRQWRVTHHPAGLAHELRNRSQPLTHGGRSSSFWSVPHPVGGYPDPRARKVANSSNGGSANREPKAAAQGGRPLTGRAEMSAEKRVHRASSATPTRPSSHVGASGWTSVSARASPCPRRCRPARSSRAARAGRWPRGSRACGGCREGSRRSRRRSPRPPRRPTRIRPRPA